ncbi:DUF5692 family protein [Ferrimonas sp. YFM]|uniref:DUF5692 family protein n=1 Tax=Ferrimonas sp. YFM TaxID=3028878 RepID=UPI002572BE99|nr:DUF5692 family protein [Ferrimonas sp. YFM]BDY05250.1 hypothetical protein F0521_22910 [Ferrimonas sp. YFM]
MEPSNLTLIVSIIVYAAVTYALTEVFRRYRYLGFAFIVGSLCTFPLWAENRDTWFEWAKIFSVLVPMVVVSLMRIAVYEKKQGPFWEIFKKPWTLWFLFFILALNITEASIHDWQLGNPWNALSGFCLVLTIPFVGKFWRVEDKTCGDLIVDFPLGWCFLYTTWNAAFLFGCIPDEFAGGLAILIACELYSVFGRHDLYIMGRIYTLAIFVVQLGLTDVFPFMDSSAWANPELATWWGIINLALSVAYVFWYNWQMYTGGCDTKFRHPASAPQGVFTDKERQDSIGGFWSHLYFHRA